MKDEKNILKIDELNNKASNAVFNNPLRGLKLSKEAFTISHSINYKFGIAESKLHEGWCLLVKSKYEESHKALDYSMENFISLKNKEGEAKVLNAFGVLYNSISNYDTAMEYYTKSLELSTKTNNNERIAASCINIGKLYSELEKYGKALDYYDKAGIVLKKTKNKEQLSVCQVYVGDIYANQGNFNKSLSYYTSGLENAESSKNRVAECNCLTSLGNTYQKIGNFNKAEKFHLQSLEIAKLLGDKLSKLECLINIGTHYLIRDDNEKSLKFYTDAFKLSKSINSKFFESKSYLGISNCYESMNMTKEALLNYKEYHNLKVELQNIEIDAKLKNKNAQNKIIAAKKETKEQRKKNTELQEAFDRVSILNKIGRDITSSLDLETVMTTIYKNISTFISADLFGIALYDKDSEEIDFKYYIMEGQRIASNKISVNIKGSMAGWVIRNKKYLFLNDVQNEYIKFVPKLIGTKVKKTSSLIFVPLLIGNDVTGVITIQSYKLNAYTDQHLEIIQAVGAYSAIALENSAVHDEINKLNKIINSEKKELERAYLKIDRLANHDILTGLPNRRLFAELLKQELRQADRHKTKIAVLFIDLDDFKPVNDKIGHDAGDKVLQMVAQRFISTLRESDAIARIGGDEFAAIICNVKNSSDIERIANKIINKFKNPFKIGNNKFQIGISMGISVYPDDDIKIDGLLKKADTAMYKIKSETKNSFVFYSESF